MNTDNSNPVYEALIAFLNRPELAGKSLLLGYSGGLDSQVLLHALAALKAQGKINTNIRAIHINHGLSDNADAWQSFTKEQCATFKIPYQAVRVDLTLQQGGGIEEKARNARYQTFAQHCEQNAVIVTAHHLDDQAETVLLALKRGAGVLGLSAMQMLRDLPGVGLIGRPLLDISRIQLTQYAEHRGLSWVEDESNQDTKFDRNFLRQRVLPLISARWQNFATSVSKSAQIQQQTQQLLEEVAQTDLQMSLADQPIVLDAFLQLSHNRQLNALRYRFKQLQIRMPEQKQLLQALTQIETAAADKNPQIKCSSAVLRRYQGRLFITPDYQDIQNWSKTVSLSENGIAETGTGETGALQFELPDGLGSLTLEAVGIIPKQIGQGDCQYIAVPADAKITLACRHDNPVCKPEDRAHSRSLKKVLQERGIPPWLRTRQIYLYVDNKFAALAGHFVCQDFTLATDIAHNKRIIKLTTNLIQK
ncbi:tRNA lysidine(34) synthetase TilS [Thalassotalea litorea]|uniref:tRNA(Ile)-lysidine synthase n=1 Tax=Thalassotalea litorea TaxID=2020715 RepID=A0A5R9IW43_9GAMM|nr:tRNA lysidine(34) synthetase TilS [Thalassotalea litorea]TLU67601.1 tRNA lysidine(34) synthetase TilS [Thalassotalea litorea]